MHAGGQASRSGERAFLGSAVLRLGRAAPGAVRNGLHGLADLGQLPIVEDAEEVVRDPAQVCGRCRPQAGEAGVGQDGLRPAGIRDARVAFDQTVGDEPIDEAGHAALAEQHLVGEVAHPDPAVRGGRDGQQRLVLGERQVVFCTQLLVEATRHPGVREQEGTPRRELRVVSGDSWTGLGHGHGGGDATAPGRSGGR